MSDAPRVTLAGDGYALVPRSDLIGNDVLHLQAWARVSGTVSIDGKPVPNIDLRVNSPDLYTLGAQRPFHRDLFAKTDENGHFELPRLMPGRWKLVQWVPNGKWIPGKMGRVWHALWATIDVESGRTYQLKIGESGQLVTGKLSLPPGDTWLIRKAEIVSTSEAKADRRVPIGLHLQRNGHFAALDLKPGDYTLRIALHEPPPPDSCGWGNLLSEYRHEFNVPERTVVTEVALDLGTLEPAEIGGPVLQVGDRAPDFSIKTLAGQDLTLAHFRGKYVLLDFWATWCAPCLAEMPNFQAIHDQYSSDPRFVLIGVSVDDAPQDAALSVKAYELSWLQGFAGPDAPVVAAYGATAVPATFLIGPEGKILARDLRGEQARAAVAEALNR